MTATQEIKAGDKVRDKYTGKCYRVRRLFDLCTIHYADLIHVRKNGTDGIRRGRNLPSLPVRFLEPAGE
jgi:hypothetical protein